MIDIIALGMNGVSNAKFAVDCYNAGIIPTISLFMSRRNINKIEEELKYYYDTVGSCDSVIISLTRIELIQLIKANLIEKYGIKRIEIIRIDKTDNLALPLIKKFKEKGFITYLKTNTKITNGIAEGIENYIDYVILKGFDGAGAYGISLYELIDFYSPKIPFIVSGGISTSKQVKHYADIGAAAIGIGTLFAYSLESPLPHEIKETICKSSTSNITNLYGKNLNSIVFSDKKLNKITETHNEIDNSLFTGINSKGKDGHIFAGKGIDNITEILPLKEIVRRLRNE